MIAVLQQHITCLHAYIQSSSQLTWITSMRTTPCVLQEKLRGAEGSKLSLEGDISALREAVAERKMEAEREGRKKERMEKEMKVGGCGRVCVYMCEIIGKAREAITMDKVRET